MTLHLTVEPRTTATKARRLRQQGLIPGVVYGPKQEPLAVAMPKPEFDKVFATAGESTIITLDGLDAPHEVLVHDVDFDPTRGGVTHVDFYAIAAGQELTTNIPLHFVGTAPVEKFGGVLTKVLYEVEVTCRPNDLPSHIDVDISVLTDFEAQITVKDLTVASGVRIEHDADEVVAVVVPVAEEQEEDAAEVDMEAIEVEQKGKKEADEEEAAA